MNDAGAEPGLPGRRPLRIGLVGPIGCGKSTVARWLGEMGAVVIDADLLARMVLDPGEPAVEEVIAAFGDEVRLPDGGVDRAALGRLVFRDPAALERLEAIVHPVVRPRIVEALDQAAFADDRSGAAAGVTVLEAIRLVDGGYASLMDEVWLVTCRPDIQRGRIALRGMDDTDREQRIAAQRDLVERAAAAATRVIDTSGSLDDTREGVLAALEAARTQG